MTQEKFPKPNPIKKIAGAGNKLQAELAKAKDRIKKLESERGIST